MASRLSFDFRRLVDKRWRISNGAQSSTAQGANDRQPGRKMHRDRCSLQRLRCRSCCKLELKLLTLRVFFTYYVDGAQRIACRLVHNIDRTTPDNANYTGSIGRGFV
jgi:hypothetical protein